MSYNVPIRRQLGGAVLEVANGGTAVVTGAVRLEDGAITIGNDGQRILDENNVVDPALLTLALPVYDATNLGDYLAIIGLQINRAIDVLRKMGAIP